MSDEFLTPFRRNDYTWRGKQAKENRSLKMRFKQAMTKLKERFMIEYEESDEIGGLIWMKPFHKGFRDQIGCGVY